MAIKNGYKIIRISDEGDFKTNILNSTFSEEYNLDSIIWEDCLAASSRSYTKQICDLRNKYDYSVYQISILTKFSTTTIRNWLKLGTKLGWCNYDPKLEHDSSVFTGEKVSPKRVLFIENNTVYKSIGSCSREFSKFIGYDVGKHLISRACNGIIDNVHGYHFKFV